MAVHGVAKSDPMDGVTELSSSVEKKNGETWVNFTVQRHKLTKDLITGYRTLPLPYSSPPCYYLQGLFIAFLFTQYITAAYQEKKQLQRRKLKRHTKWQKSQSEEMEQASELNMAGMLELSDPESKAVNIVRVLMDKVDSREEQMDNVSREMQILRKN